MIYVISDIHGNKKAFDSILNQINLQPNDDLYILGDIIDRQEYGIELIQQIMKMDNVHMILGNHEYMMMDALGFPYEVDDYTNINPTISKNNWFKNGGNVTYNAWIKLNNDEQEAIKKYLRDLPLNYDVEVNGRKFKLVHAVPTCLYDILIKHHPDKIVESKVQFAVWERELIELMNEFDDFTTVFGHTPTVYFTNSLPMQIYCNRNIIGIDCGAAYTNTEENHDYRLACLRLNDMKKFYSE